MTLIRREDRMQQGFVDFVDPMDTVPVSAESRNEITKSRSCKMKPQPRKKLRSLKITTKDLDLATDMGIGLIGTMIMGL